MTPSQSKSSVARMLPLYEAKMIHQYDHRWATYEPDGSTRNVTLDEKQDPSFVVMPRYWVDESDIQQKLDGKWDSPWLLGWRDICRNNDERTTISSVFPLSAVGNNLPIIVGSIDDSQGWFLEANLSAFALDYAARLKIGGVHMNFFAFTQLPVLAPSILGSSCAWQADLTVGAWIVPRATQLSQASGWDERRGQRRAELDAAFFHLYGIERDDMDYIMETFLIVKRKDIAAHGEFRTKLMILEVYDAMRVAIDTGIPYRSEFDEELTHG